MSSLRLLDCFSKRHAVFLCESWSHVRVLQTARSPIAVMMPYYLAYVALALILLIIFQLTAPPTRSTCESSARLNQLIRSLEWSNRALVCSNSVLHRVLRARKTWFCYCIMIVFLAETLACCSHLRLPCSCGSDRSFAHSRHLQCMLLRSCALLAHPAALLCFHSLIRFRVPHRFRRVCWACLALTWAFPCFSALPSRSR